MFGGLSLFARGAYSLDSSSLFCSVHVLGSRLSSSIKICSFFVGMCGGSFSSSMRTFGEVNETFYDSVSAIGASGNYFSSS